MPSPEPRAEMVQRLRDAAWTDDEGRTTVHSFAGFLGADWDLDHAVAFVQDADDAWWAPHLFRHELAAGKDGRVIRFAVLRPAPDAQEGDPA